MKTLFWDLLVRMIVIVTVFDIVGYCAFVYRKGTLVTLILLIVVELIAITISLWFDIYVRKLTV
jgi:hypothetical protein